MNNPTYISGIVEEIVYSNYANGYTVCTLDCNGDMVTATGCMPYLSEGENVKLTGKWVTHPEYGEQFSVSLYEKVAPTASLEIMRYLASGVIKGVRLATAKKIVDKFGDDTLNVILTTPEKLAEISGISLARALEIGTEYATQQKISSVVMFLQQYGIGAKTALKVYQRFGSDAVTYIKDDPYVLVDEISGVGFNTIDRVASSMGITPQNISRLKAGIKYILSFNAMNSGHTYIPQNALISTASNMLEVEEAEIERALYALRIEGSVIVAEIDGEEGVFLKKMYEAEKHICLRIEKMAERAGIMPEKEAKKMVDEWEKTGKIKLAEEQKTAVIYALSSHIMVLTGGPGTGKTTIVNTIIEILSKNKISIALAAPTGRAAKRMSEVTGLEAKTIHRLLEMNYTDDEQYIFSRDEQNPIDADFVIVDETSMVDVLLGSSLFAALKPNAHIIMVGDADQLPPVGAGNMLGDIIASKKVKTVRLTKIFRQAAQSMIIQNAHRIISGQNPILNQADSDFYFVACAGMESIAANVTNLCKKRLPDAYGYDPLEQIQVLSAMKKGICGVKNLNKLLQQSLNPPSDRKQEHRMGENVFREGDKVMQIKNNYDMPWENTSGKDDGMGIFNGDIGYIEEIDNTSRYISVVYDDKRVTYNFEMLDELELAYATTVHKSQGSEFDVVVMPVYPAAPMLMKRNLLYTALTRAKQLVVLVGIEDSIHKMVASDSETKRYTAIRNLLANEKA